VPEVEREGPCHRRDMIGSVPSNGLAPKGGTRVAHSPIDALPSVASPAAARRASPLSPHDLLERHVVGHRIDQQSFELPIFRLEFSQPFRLAGLQAAVLRLPTINGLLADTVPIRCCLARSRSVLDRVRLPTAVLAHVRTSVDSMPCSVGFLSKRAKIMKCVTRSTGTQNVGMYQAAPR